MMLHTLRQRAAALALALLSTAQLAIAQTYNFASGSGGFTTPGAYNPWGYDAVAGQWYQIGQLEANSRLVSPTVTAAGGAAKLDLMHTFALDGYTDFYGQIHCYDIGIFEVSVNGGAFTNVAPDRALLYKGIADINSGNPMKGNRGFCGSTPSPGLMTLSGWDFTFAAGDQVQFAFDASWDRVSNSPSSSWRLASVALSGFGAPAVVATPEPSSLIMLGTGLVVFIGVHSRRRTN